MSNSKKVISAELIFKELKEMEPEEFKKLLAEHATGDVYESMKELLDTDLYFTGEESENI